MYFALALLSALASSPRDTVPVSSSLEGTVAHPVGIGAQPFRNDTVPARRRKAIDISDAYATRLKIHYVASFATIPIFAAQAIIGERMYAEENDPVNSTRPSQSLRDSHDIIAATLGGLFAVNTVTGAWNWWDTRHNAEGRTWRTIHAALMLVADGGFAYTAWLGPGANYRRGTPDGRTLHKNWAIGSATVAMVSYVMMWKPFRKD